MSDDQTRGTSAPEQEGPRPHAAEQPAGPDASPRGPDLSAAPPREADSALNDPAGAGRDRDWNAAGPVPDPGMSSPSTPGYAAAESVRPAAPSPTPSPTAAPSPTGGPTGAGAAERFGAPTTVLPSSSDLRPPRPSAARAPGPDPRTATARATRPVGRARRARLVLQRVDPWSVFLFSLVASICLGVILLVAVAALYAVLSGLGVLSSVNGVLGEVLGGTGPDEVVEPYITAGRVLGGTAVLAAVDVVLLTALATLGALLYNLCASLTGGIEVVLGEHE